MPEESLPVPPTATMPTFSPWRCVPSAVPAFQQSNLCSSRHHHTLSVAHCFLPFNGAFEPLFQRHARLESQQLFCFTHIRNAPAYVLVVFAADFVVRNKLQPQWFFTSGEAMDHIRQLDN